MFIDSFQEKIWVDKYQYKGETFEGFCNRISENIFRDDEENKVKLYDMLHNFEVLFGGRINSNIGVDEEGLTLFNCFIESISKEPDSLAGIMDMLSKYVTTLKTEGGVGFCADFFRPAKTIIRKIGVASPGAIKFLEIFDKASEVITSGSVDKGDCFQGTPTKSSIRKGATMVTMSVSHPDIEEFITAKSTPNRLTKMNMSVMVTDEFVEAVRNDDDWDLWFPDINCEQYDSEWDGNLKKWKEKGYPVVVYKTTRAVDLWDVVMRNSFNRNEPGVLFIDNARKMNNLSYLNGDMLSTNPCVTGDTLIHTSNGLERAIDLYNQGTPNRVLVDMQHIENRKGVDVFPSTFVFATGERDVYKITTSMGYEIKATEYHRFPTDGKEKELKDLKVGDKLFLCSGEGKFGKDGNKEFGRIIGLVAGDGTIYKGVSKRDNCKLNKVYVRLWSKDGEFASELVDSINSVIADFGGDYSNIKLKKMYDSKRDISYSASGVLYRIFEKFGLLDIKDEVPKFVFTGSRELAIGYLQGLFQADGSVNVAEKSRCSIRLNGSNVQLLKDVQILLSNFGIKSSVLLRRKAAFRNMPDGHGGLKPYWCKDNYDLIISSQSRDIFMREIGFILPYKSDKYKDWVKDREVYTQEFTDKITSIEYAGKETTYCLTQPTNSSMICNGISTLQCGEIFGHTGAEYTEHGLVELGDVCNLGSINLTKFYDVESSTFDDRKMKEAVDLMVRALDNVIEVSNYPLDIYEQAAKLKRKIGVGFMGLGSLMMMLNVRYGSDDCVKFLDIMLKHFVNQAYQTSALLAKDKGPFPLWDKKAMDSGFIKNSGALTEETLDMIKKYGLRHSALLAVAPNGTLSIVAGNVSGGVEPVFATEFTRWNRVEGKKVDFRYPNIHKGEWFETDYFKESKAGDEPVLVSTDSRYRIDKNTGLCEKVTIMDYGYKIAKGKDFTETATAMELSVEEHLKTLGVISKYVDQSSSKTINLPNDITFEDFKALYNEIHSYGIKGCTTYREGTSVAVLETQKKEQEKTIKEQQEEFLEAFRDQKDDSVIADDVKLPEEYPAKGFILRSEGKKYYLHVAFKDLECTKPFALFVNTNNKEDNVLTYNALEKLEDIAIFSGLRQELIEEVKKKYSGQQNTVKICRMLGLLLRHNVDVLTIVKGLDELMAGPWTFIFRIKKFLSQFVEDHVVEGMACPECGEKSIVFMEGCYKCSSCGGSKCG